MSIRRSAVLAVSVPTPQFVPQLNRLTACLIHSPWTLLVCKLTIGVVSAYDIHLTIKYVDSLPSLELNPLGRWLMSLDTGPNCDLKQIACFITAKFAGNFITLAVIELLSSWRKPAATAVAFAVAACQLLLLYFLIFGE